MSCEDAQWWAEALCENFLDVAGDEETHFKIAAVRRLIERNKELEDALSNANEQIQAAQAYLGRAL